uniref:Ubiquitin carboxyl-terminal hydrolase n=1 Tax=Macrostomum lignano TaxID=282301 RepID=A0A1I8G944_9PLAT
ITAILTIKKPRSILFYSFFPLHFFKQVLNKYAHSLGLSTQWNFMDVFSLDKELLDMLPKPVACLLFIYPITDKSEAAPIGEKLPASTEGVYFMKQTVSNACGTVALLHAIANKRDQLQIEKDSTLDKFFAKTKDSTPEERAKIMETDEVQSRLKFIAKLLSSGASGSVSGGVGGARRRDATGLNTAHESVATEGQTSAPDRESRTNLHYIALLNRGGKILEFDGRRDGPVSHGDTNESNFLADSATVVQKFMARQSDDLNFSIVALAKGESPF